MQRDEESALIWSVSLATLTLSHTFYVKPTRGDVLRELSIRCKQLFFGCYLHAHWPPSTHLSLLRCPVSVHRVRHRDAVAPVGRCCRLHHRQNTEMTKNQLRACQSESKKEFGYLKISLCFEPFVGLYIRDNCFLSSKKGSCKCLLQNLVSVQSPQMVFICPNHNFLRNAKIAPRQN